MSCQQFRTHVNAPMPAVKLFHCTCSCVLHAAGRILQAKLTPRQAPSIRSAAFALDQRSLDLAASFAQVEKANTEVQQYLHVKKKTMTPWRSRSFIWSNDSNAGQLRQLPDRLSHARLFEDGAVDHIVGELVQHLFTVVCLAPWS